MAAGASCRAGKCIEADAEVEVEALAKAAAGAGAVAGVGAEAVDCEVAGATNESNAGQCLLLLDCRVGKVRLLSTVVAIAIELQQTSRRIVWSEVALARQRRR